MINYSFDALEKLNTCFTFEEICQQPETFQKAYEIISNLKNSNNKLDEFLKDKNARIILTGAGSSAFVGQAIAPNLTTSLNRVVEAIATTDIVSNPYQFLLKSDKTVLVSFARSGNSPESVAATEIAEKVVDTLFHVIITCNKDGKLAKTYEGKDNALVVLLPEETNDRGFAMTSSFSTMLLSAKLLFDKNITKKNIDILCEELNNKETDYKNITKLFSDRVYKRMICIGSGGILGFARESALKSLELTCGKVMTGYESSLGFRHGPKSVVDSETLVVFLVSKDEYTRKYDVDMINEMMKDTKGAKVVALFPNESVSKLVTSDMERYVLKVAGELEDTLIGLSYLPIMQLLALETSALIGLTPDNPSPDGFVNRVVQGVRIHSL